MFSATCSDCTTQVTLFSFTLDLHNMLSYLLKLTVVAAAVSALSVTATPVVHSKDAVSKRVNFVSYFIVTKCRRC